MYRIPRSNPWPPQIDLSTLQETLHYMHDSLTHTPGLEKLRDALALAMKEAEEAQTSARSRPTNIINARFLPRWF